MRALVPFLAALLLASLAAARPIGKEKSRVSGVDRKISTALRTELDRFDALAKTQGIASAEERFARRMSGHPLIRVGPDGKVFVTIRLSDYTSGIEAELAALGAEVHRSSARWKTVEAWVVPGRVREVASHPLVSGIRPIERPRMRAGSRMSEGDAILRADLVRQMGFDGTGAKVGVMSDGVAGLSASRASGDLPNVTVLAGYAGPADGAEGTAMLEIVHDLAPGADLYFATAFISPLSFAQGITALADSGCDVIVDDVGYFSEPMFEDGIIAQAVDEVTARGVSYFSSAGNSAQEHYQRDYVAANPAALADSNAYHWHAWDGVADSAFAVVVPAGDTIIVFAQWNDPFGGAMTDYDIFLFGSPELHPDAHDPKVNVLAVGGDYQGPDEPSDPFEFFAYGNASQSPETTYVAIDLYAGEPKFLSVFVLDASDIEWVVSEGSVWGHPSARGAIAVGAINASEPAHDDIAYYSSWGPAEVYFPTRETRLKPDITGIDGVSVTGAGGFATQFYGTSASAPHVAAVAALLRQAHPSWGPNEVFSALTTTANDYGEAGPDIVYGYGLAQADAAVSAMGETFANGTITTRTWTKVKGPYRVTGAITVPSANTLTIEPGVDVLFDADVQFIVNGGLHAVGTPQDSIRFIKGSAPEWGGIRITGPDSSTIAYARISDGHADGDSPDDQGGGLDVLYARVALAHGVVSNNAAVYGGGVHVGGATAAAYVTDCRFERNVAHLGGGLTLTWGAYVQMEGCAVGHNQAYEGGGLNIQQDSAYVSLGRCTITDNEASHGGGGFVVYHTATLVLTNCTSHGNSGGDWGGAMWLDAAEAIVNNCIIWGDMPSELKQYEGALTVTFSDIAEATAKAATFPGRGWGAALTPTGILPQAARRSAEEPYSRPARAVELARVTSALPGEGNINLDPLFVNAANGDYHLSRGSPCIDAGDPNSPLDPDGTRADMGALPLLRPFGDASGDGLLTSFDASLILQHVVGIHSLINELIADVTGNGFVSSFDAALVLLKVLDPKYLFPVEGGRLPKVKAAAGTPRTLVWQPDNRGWTLLLDDASGVIAGEMTLALRDELPVTVAGPSYLSFRQEGPLVRVAFVRSSPDDLVLFRLEAAKPLIDAPKVTEAQLNEGEIAVTGVGRPVRFALDHNIPNPFNPTTTLRFSVPDAGAVRLVIYDVNGRLVLALVDGTLDAGTHEAVWDGQDAAGRDASSGVYLYRLTSEHGSIVRRMTLLR